MYRFVLLIERKLYHNILEALPKAKAAITSCRTFANTIDVARTLEANINTMINIVLHCTEFGYNTAHSYFLETFEQRLYMT